jgi:predicted outer membrane protein
MQWGCEPLEERALLSSVHASILKAAHHPVVGLRHQQVTARVVGAASRGANPGIGASAAPNAAATPADAGTVALQQAASANNLEMFLAQLAMFSGQGAAQQAALTVLNQDRDIDLQIHSLADSLGTVVPSDITPSDQPIAKQVVTSINKSSADQTAFLNAVVQAETQRIGQLQQQISSVPAGGVKDLLQSMLPVVRAHLAAAQALLAGTSPVTGPAPSTTPSSATLNGGDLQILERSYSTTLTERFLAQLTDLQSNNSNVQLYAQKLINDHEQEVLEIGRYAAATQTYLPANIQGTDVQTSQKVLSAVNSRRYDNNYLKTMVQSHTMDIKDNWQTIAGGGRRAKLSLSESSSGGMRRRLRRSDPSIPPLTPRNRLLGFQQDGRLPPAGRQPSPAGDRLECGTSRS